MKDVFSSFPQARFPRFENQLRDAMSGLSNLEAQVAQYIMLNMGDLSFETGASLANKVGVSEVTVSRFLRRLGYEGMRGLKQALQAELASQEIPTELLAPDPADEQPQPYADILARELKALRGVFLHCGTPMWHEFIDTVANSSRVYVTGFQTVRGVAEDTARRLALVRSDVRFVSAHDSMLAEWLVDGNHPTAHDECLILIDVVPYAREAPVLAEHCYRTGRKLVMVTDERCHWAAEFTQLVVHAGSRSGLFYESTVGITAALNLIVHAVAERKPEAMEARLEQWRAMSRSLNVF